MHSKENPSLATFSNLKIKAWGITKTSTRIAGGRSHLVNHLARLDDRTDLGCHMVAFEYACSSVRGYPKSWASHAQGKQQYTVIYPVNLLSIMSKNSCACWPEPG